MSFVSPEFALLALLFFPLYWALIPRPGVQQAVLTASGLALYASWAPMFAGLLLAYGVAVWLLGRWIARAAAGRPQRRALALSLVLAVLFLAVVKYGEFLRASAATLCASLGLTLPLPVLDLVAPVGVSFFTFQAITYLVALGEPGARPRPLRAVLLFLCFWPTLFAGPILRAGDFMAQLDAGHTGRPLQPWRALYLVLLGLAQKLVCASWLADTYVDPVFRYPEAHGGLAVLAALVAYALQIFLDFGGYTLIVTGLALLLGYTLPANFRQPYLARNLQEFWQRWHISLSSFIRDYIYIPLGGNRRGHARTQAHVLLAMVVSGAWHGANWTFLAWGLLHGLGMLVFNAARHAGLPAWPRPLAHGLTLAFVGLAWLPFRADSLEQAWAVLQRTGSGLAGWLPRDDLPLGPLLAFVGAFAVLSHHAPALEAWAVQQLRRLPAVPLAAGLSLALALIILLAPDGVPSFIYYRF